MPVVGADRPVVFLALAVYEVQGDAVAIGVVVLVTFALRLVPADRC